MTANSMVDSQSISKPTSSSANSNPKRSGAGSQRAAAVGTSAGSRANANANGSQENRKPAKRGFAAMDPARQREIAAQGGRAAHESGNAHQFTTEEARAAGKKSHSTRQQRNALRPPL